MSSSCQRCLLTNLLRLFFCQRNKTHAIFACVHTSSDSANHDDGHIRIELMSEKDALVIWIKEATRMNGRFYRTMFYCLVSVVTSSLLLRSIIAEMSFYDRKRSTRCHMIFDCSSYVGHQFMSPLAFQKQPGIDLPIMHDMARCFLSASATSVQSESAFSVSAHYARKERSQLSANNLAMSVYLKDKL